MLQEVVYAMYYTTINLNIPSIEFVNNSTDYQATLYPIY